MAADPPRTWKNRTSRSEKPRPAPEIKGNGETSRDQPDTCPGSFARRRSLHHDERYPAVAATSVRRDENHGRSSFAHTDKSKVKEAPLIPRIDPRYFPPLTKRRNQCATFFGRGFLTIPLALSRQRFNIIGEKRTVEASTETRSKLPESSIQQAGIMGEKLHKRTVITKPR